MSNSERFTDENELGRIEACASYEWAEFHAWKYDGRIWYAEDSGCSCNWWDTGYVDVTPVNSVHELFSYASQFVESAKGYGVNIDDYTRFVTQVQKRMTEI